MDHPARDRLARAALGLDQDVSNHLATCPVCRAELAAMRSALDRLAEGHAALERGHDEARERLLSLLPDPALRPEPAGIWNAFILWMGGSAMRRGMVFGGLGTLGVLTLGVLWVGLAAGKASAMGLVAEAIREAKSYRCVMTIELATPRDDGFPDPLINRTRYFRRVDGSFRAESEGAPPNAAREVVTVMPAGRPGVEIDRTEKAFIRLPAQLGKTSPLWMLEGLASFSGDADRDLGAKVVDGKPARGFAIASEKIDPDVHDGPVEIWVDSATNLPLRVSYALPHPSGPFAARLHDFVWDADLSPALFDPTPPEGFADRTPPPTRLDDQVAKIVDGLKIYAKYGGGHYPRVAMLYGDSTRDELIKLSGAPFPSRTDAAAPDERAAEISRAAAGFARINAILRDNPDAAYRGKTVGPRDADKVLLRWKADEGGYHVLFGDLRFETVTPERLRSLEGR